ncbi:MAG: PA14 domain-containing protein, partial [Anaerolineae bacterium]|nr:PA14 domain-containing protein [Anaerolineae bacterium]
DPDAFWYRTRQISIFTKRDEANVNQALWENSRKHLLMFNYAGDKNGRHNLPGEPMLDPLMGVFWVMGIGLTLAGLLRFSRRSHPLELFFPLLFVTALIGGVFSVDFEAPQSLRSIAVIPAIIYFAAVAVAALGREMERNFRPLSHYWLTVPTAVVAGVILVLNAATYFGEQGTDFSSWNAFSTPETLVGQKMAELGPEYTYLVSPFFNNHPSIRFLAPQATDQRPLTLPNALPVRLAAEKPVGLFIHPDDVAVFDQARELYPEADFEIMTSRASDERPVVYFVDLQPANLAAIQGLTLKYYLPEAVDTDNPAPLQSQRVPTVNVTWPQAGPAVDDFVAEWQGILYAADYGAYTLHLTTPGPATLEIDGKVVFEGHGDQLIPRVLAQGNHQFRLRVEAGEGQVLLAWTPPGEAETLVPQEAFYGPPITNNGLQGTFYPNADWSGDPVLQRIDPVLDTYFHLIPLPRPYSVVWEGWLDVPQTGVYRLGLRAVEFAELFVDGNLLVATNAQNQLIDQAITLEARPHKIRIRFKDTVDRSRIHLYWTRPNGDFEAIPSQYLYPPSDEPPEPVRLQTLAPVETQPLELAWRLTIGFQGGDGPGQFLEPRDVAVQQNGNLIVADTGNKRVQILDTQGNPIRTLTGDDLPFEEPLAVVVSSRDEIFVLESTLQWIYHYDAEGDFITRFGGPEAHFFHPRGLSILADDTLVVADTGTASLKFFSPGGALRGQIGTLGDGPGQF